MPGRKSKDVSVTLDRFLGRRLEKAARLLRTSRAGVIRLAIRKELPHQEEASVLLHTPSRDNAVLLDERLRERTG